MRIYRYIIAGLIALGLLLNVGVTEEQEGFYYKEKVTQSDLYGVWAVAVEEGDASLLNMSILQKNGEGLDIYILKDRVDSFKLRQHYRWEFLEEKQLYIQHIRKITIQTNEDIEEEFPDSSGSAKVKIMMLDRDIAGLVFEDDSGESTTLLKISPESMRDILQKIDMKGLE